MDATSSTSSTSSASSSADIAADIFRLIPPEERAAFREMLRHELHGRELPDGELRRVAERTWRLFCVSAGQSLRKSPLRNDCNGTFTTLVNLLGGLRGPSPSRGPSRPSMGRRQRG